MPRIFSTLLLILLAPLLVIFFVANRAPVTISFDPSSLEDPALALTAPLWAGLCGTLLIGFFLGGVGMWISTSKLRRKEREHRRRVRELEREVAQFEDRPAVGKTNLPAVR